MRSRPWVYLLPSLVGIAFTFYAEADEDVSSFFHLPESPIIGGRLFMEKGCVNCHAIQSLGGVGGPDLGKVRAGWSFLDIAGVMWNHTPKMQEEFKYRGLIRPQLSSEEMFQLINFIYFLNYFGNPGDVDRGKSIFTQKMCNTCHSVGNQGNPDGIPLDRFQPFRSPAYISAALWNASEKMTIAMQKKYIARPEYEGDDISNILAFIRKEAYPGVQERPIYLPHGNSKNGMVQFKEKGCVNCHPVRGEGMGQVGPDLGSRQAGGTLSEMAGAMWNHAPDMWESMKENKIKNPNFSPQEISDIITFLYFSSFLDRPGNLDKGSMLFQEKGCIACHDVSGQKEFDGPDVSDIALESVPEVIAAMWNHASEMEEAVRTINITWPQFKSGEMNDLIAYIKSRSQQEP